MKKALLGLSIIAILSPAAASAQNFNSYMGVSIGHTELDLDGDGAAILNTYDTLLDDTDVGFKFFVGNRLHKNLALELYYVDLGEVTATDGSATATVQTDGFGISALGILPISNNFELFAKVGTFKWDATVKAPGVTLGDDDLDETYGIGASFLMDQLSIRVEYEQYGVDGADYDMFSAGLAYNY